MKYLFLSLLMSCSTGPSNYNTKEMRILLEQSHDNKIIIDGMYFMIKELLERQRQSLRALNKEADEIVLNILNKEK